MKRENIRDSLFQNLFSKLDPVESINRNILAVQGKKLFPYQEQIARAVCDSSVRKVVILCSRQAGKTETVAAGTLQLAWDNPGMKVGFFAPKSQQAGIGVTRIKEFIEFNKATAPTSVKQQNQSLIRFDNSSEIHIVSASDQANIEGLTFDVIILDESQKISDYTVSERILPMGGATGAKIIQIGTPKYRNHFWKATQDPTYKFLRFDWLDCDNLHQPHRGEGVIKIGKRNYGLYVLDRMPRVLKQEYFKEEFEAALKENDQRLIQILSADGDMAPEDFKTQYMLDWALDVDSFLAEQEINILKSGKHELLEYGMPNEEYYAGIDFAGSETYGSDYTVISVWRKTFGSIKEKVFSYEMFGMDYPSQISIIHQLLNKQNGLFKCKAVYGDYTGVGRPVVQMLTQMGVPLHGIIFNAVDTITNSGTNLKTAMFTNFKFDLIHGRVRYPARPKNSKDAILYLKALDEWSVLVAKRSETQNKKISAPDGGHDDHVCADILAVYAANTSTLKSYRPHGVIARFTRK